MSEREKTCAACRWCLAGRECRFFETDREDRVETNSARRCPFFEGRALLDKMDDLAAALREIAERLEWLQ